MHRCLPCSGKELVPSRLDGGCPPAAPRSYSVLGPIRHDMKSISISGKDHHDENYR
jgi:hypothetical protein